MKRLLTQQEAAELLNVDVRFLIRRVRDERPEHRIVAIKFGRVYRFRESDLEDYISRQEVKSKVKQKAGRPLRQTAMEIENELAVMELEEMGFEVGGPEF